jgi:hypothetical protein
MKATMPVHEITIDQAAAVFLGLLSVGYGDGQPIDWVSRGAPSERRVSTPSGLRPTRR